MPKRKTDKEFKSEVRALVGDKYSVLSNYVNSKKKVLIRHNKCGRSWEVIPNNFLRGARCPYCSNTYHTKRTNKQFVSELIDLVGNGYTVLDKYQGSDIKIRFKHNICGNIFLSTPYRFLKMGQRCPKCSRIESAKKHRQTNQSFKNHVKRLVGNEYTFLDPYQGSKVKIRVRHNKCGNIYKVTPYKFLDNRRCPYCLQSRGENKIDFILKNSVLYYSYPYKTSDLVDKQELHYDFCIPSQKILIEYQGRQHYEPVDYFGGEASFKKQQKHDQMKREYAKNHGYKLIEVPYYINTKDSIKEYLISKGLKLQTKINKNKISFKQVVPKEVHQLMTIYHYLHRTVICSYAFAMYYQEELVGMVTYSPVRKSLAQSISDKATRDNTLELSRLYIKDEVSQNIPNITSEFVGWSLRQLKKQGNWYIISFADSGMNHIGAIYQATNFLYCGHTKDGIFCYNGPGRKGGAWVAGTKYRFFIVRSMKYRYVKFIGSKTFKKHARKELKFNIKDYPKSNNVHYSVGDTEDRYIKDRKTGKIYSEKELLKAFPDYDWNSKGQNW